jgi:hypothetical protein
LGKAQVELQTSSGTQVIVRAQLGNNVLHLSAGQVQHAYVSCWVPKICAAAPNEGTLPPPLLVGQDPSLLVKRMKSRIRARKRTHPP